MYDIKLSKALTLVESAFPERLESETSFAELKNGSIFNSSMKFSYYRTVF